MSSQDNRPWTTSTSPTTKPTTSYQVQAPVVGRTSVARPSSRSSPRSFNHTTFTVLRSFDRWVVQLLGLQAVYSVDSSPCPMVPYRPPTTRSFGRSTFDSNDSTNDEIPESKSWSPGPTQLPTHSVVQSFGLSVVRSFGLWVPRRLGWSVAHTPAQWFHPSFGRPQVVTVAPVVPVVPVVLVLQTTNDLNDPYNDEIPESKSSGPVVNPRLQRHPHDPVVPLVPLDKLVPQFQSSDLPNNPPVVVTQVRQQNLYRSTRPPSTTSNFGTRERTRWCPPP